MSEIKTVQAIFYDEFLQRRQLRVVSVHEFVQRMLKSPKFIKEGKTLLEGQTSQCANPTFMTDLPLYGDKKWR